MIKLLHAIGALFLGFAAWVSPAQAQVQVDAAGNVNIVMTEMKAVGYGPWIDISKYGITEHTLSYRVVGTPASFTLTLECSNTGSEGAATSVLGTGTTVTGGAITASSTPCTKIRSHLSAISGTATIYLPYHGGFVATGASSAVTASQSTASLLNATIIGTKTNNNAAPSSTNLGVLPCLANAAAPSWTEGNSVQDSCDLGGAKRVTAPPDTINTTPPAYANADPISHFEYALNGQIVLMPYQNPAYFVNGTTAAITDTTSTSVIASAGGSLRNYITQCTASNSHASVDTLVKILDGSTIIYEAIAVHGSGWSTNFPTPLRGTAATAINAQPVTTGTSTIVSCSGFKGL